MHRSGVRTILVCLLIATLLAPLSWGAPGRTNTTRAGDLVALGDTPGVLVDPPTLNETVAPSEPPAGLGIIDPWLDAQGDTLFGDLVVGPNALVFQGGALSTASPGQLQFAGANVCYEGSPWCGVVRRVETGAGLTGGPVTDQGTISVADGGVVNAMLADAAVSEGKLDFDPATQAELDAYVPDWNALANVPAGFADGVDDDTTYAAGTGLVLAGTTFSVMGCADDDILRTLAGAWGCDVDRDTTYSAGSGLSLAGNVFSNTGDTNAADDVLATTAHGGDVAGTYNNLQLASGSVGSAEIANGGILFADLASNGCGTNQVMKWGGSAWACAADVDTNSGGTVTSVATGAGLAGGPVTTTGTLSIATGGVTSAMIQDGTVAVADLAFDPATQAELNALPIGRPGFTRTTLDTIGHVGAQTSIAIGTDGLGLISYSDETNGDLKVAHCSNLACTAATISTLDSAGSVAWYTSLAIGADGFGLISYWDITNADLKVAHCSNAACTAATLTTLDSTGSVGLFTSITIGADGLGLVSYYDQTNADLKVAHCSNAACTAATLTTLASAGDVGRSTAMTIGADGLALIVYADTTGGLVKVAHCSDAVCSAATFATIASAVVEGHCTSITVGTDGLGLIAFCSVGPNDLKVAHCADVACTGAAVVTLDAFGTVGEYPSVTIGADGVGLISYYDRSNGDLNLAHCSNTACSTATLVSPDTAGNTGADTSITIGVDGLGIVSYRDGGNGDLRVAHLSNALGIPYHRAR